MKHFISGSMAGGWYPCGVRWQLGLGTHVYVDVTCTDCKAYPNPKPRQLVHFKVSNGAACDLEDSNYALKDTDLSTFILNRVTCADCDDVVCRWIHWSLIGFEAVRMIICGVDSDLYDFVEDFGSVTCPNCLFVKENVLNVASS